VEVDLVGAVLARLDYQPLQQAALGKERELKIDRAVVKITDSFSFVKITDTKLLIWSIIRRY
jgi:hypothetical protein